MARFRIAVTLEFEVEADSEEVAIHEGFCVGDQAENALDRHDISYAGSDVVFVEIGPSARAFYYAQYLDRTNGVR